MEAILFEDKVTILMIAILMEKHSLIEMLLGGDVLTNPEFGHWRRRKLEPPHPRHKPREPPQPPAIPTPSPRTQIEQPMIQGR